MTMSINHLTFVISIPKADTIFESTNTETGYEIRTLDEESFMRELSAYLDGEDGIVLPDTHEHFTVQILSGTPYARMFRMLAPYTITIEDGMYQVKLTGGTNTNFIDFLNPNNVSVIPDNSAGKQVIVSGSGVTEQDKEDIIQGTLNTDNSGNENFNTLGGAISHLKHLEYRIFIDTESVEPEADQDGSQHHSYSNESVAIDYAEAHGLFNLQIKSNIDLTRNVKNFYVTSANIKKVDAGGFNLDGSRFSHIELFSDYTGFITAQECNLTGGTLNGFFQNCAIGSNFIIPNLGRALVKDCAVFAEGFTIPPSFDIGGLSGTATLHLMGYVGGAKIINCNQTTDEVKIVATGQIEIENSCTNGNIIVFGIVKPVDNSGSGCNVIWNNIDPSKLENIPDDVWHGIQLP